MFYILTLGSLEETIAETQTVPENLPEVLNDFEEEEEVGQWDINFLNMLSCCILITLYSGGNSRQRVELGEN